MVRQFPKFPLLNNEFDGRKLISDLVSVPDEAALETAEFFENVAKRLRRQHELYEYRQSVKLGSRNRLTEIERLPGSVLDRMIVGHSFEDAAQLVARDKDVELETVYNYWLSAIAEIQRTAKAKRDKKIYAMFRNNFSNIEIAQAVGLSTRQVRRILKRLRTAKGISG